MLSAQDCPMPFPLEMSLSSQEIRSVFSGLPVLIYDSLLHGSVLQANSN